MDYIIIIINIVVITLLGNYLNNYLKKRAAKKPKTKEQITQQKKNYIFLREIEETNSRADVFLQPTVFKPKIGIAVRLLYSFFIVIGGIIFYFNIKGENDILEVLFPLLFVLLGLYIYVNAHTTRYALDNYGLKAYTKFEKIEVPYSDIISVHKREINLLFKHGKFGRIRMETDAETLWITTSKPIKGNSNVMMISPKEKEKFITLLRQKLMAS